MVCALPCDFVSSHFGLAVEDGRLLLAVNVVFNITVTYHIFMYCWAVNDFNQWLNVGKVVAQLDTL